MTPKMRRHKLSSHRCHPSRGSAAQPPCASTLATAAHERGLASSLALCGGSTFYVCKLVPV
eukprot:4334374-Pyramimonas_sp.AAC.1